MIAIMQNPLSSIFSDSQSRALAPRDVLFRIGDPVRFVYQIINGSIALQRSTPNGSVLTLQIARAGSILAEASLYSSAYHCDAIALEETAIAQVARSSARKALRNSSEMAEKWAAYLAQSVQQARSSSEIRSFNTVSARLDAWISLGGQLPEKGFYQDLAAELSVSREALYRELSRRNLKNKGST